ncbi:MAG: WYL domain-containing protein [Sarcina sp.]
MNEDIRADLINFYGPSVITNKKEDKYIASIPFNGTDAEYRYLLSFATKATVLEPIDVKEKLVTLIKETLTSYN